MTRLAQLARGSRTLVGAAFVAVLTICLGLYNIDFPIGQHPDEIWKAQLATGYPHNYAHPPLLIVLARVVAYFSGATEQLDFLFAGRLVSVLAAAAAGALFFLTLSRFTDRLNAFLWSCAFAASPAIAVHAHYFKEDIVLVMAICLGLHALVILGQRRNLVRLIYFGLALGLAPTAKYVGIINSVMLFGVAVVWCKLNWRQALLVAFAFLLSVLAVFSASLLTETGTSLSTISAGLDMELRHSLEGHDIRDWFWGGWGLTHLRYHLLPSMTPLAVVIVASAALVAIAIDRDKPAMAFAAGGLVWLSVLEASPLKLIGQMRYILPVFVYAAAVGGVAVSRSIGKRNKWAALSLSSLVLAVSAHAGHSYVANMGPANDTRAAAVQFLATQGQVSFVADYPLGYPGGFTPNYGDLQKIDFLVSMRFQRYLRGGTLSEQRQSIYRLASMFKCLDGFVAAQFSREYGDYAFVAPTVKIYDLRRARHCLPETELPPFG